MEPELKIEDQISHESKFQFLEQLGQVCLNLSQQMRAKYVTSETIKNINPRQLLKAWKKAIGGEVTQDKLNISQYFGSLIIKQYIFGSIQSKPTLINLIRGLQLSPKLFKCHVSLIKQRKQLKHFIEVLEVYVSTTQKKDQLATQCKEELKELIKKLSQQLKQGQAMILKNQFRTVWLDTFVHILRNLNSLIRIYQFSQNELEQIKSSVKNCLTQSNILTKQALTQLYLLLLFIDKNQLQPSQNLNKMHYLNAKAIIYNQKTIAKLLLIIPQLKQTEHRFQISPILLKAFQLQFESYQDKANAFDQVVGLFDSGRAIHSYLQSILSIIIKNGGSWNLEGNMQRKFFTAKIILKYATTKDILAQWPTLLEDCMMNAGNLNVPFSAQCAQLFLSNLYIQLEKDNDKWTEVWIPIYIKALKSNDKAVLKSIVQYVNPIIIKISQQPTLLKYLLKNEQMLNEQISVISLLKCYRDAGRIRILFGKQSNLAVYKFITETHKNQTLIQLIEQDIHLPSQHLKKMLLSSDLLLVTKCLEFIVHLQKPSELLLPSQYQLLLHFYRNSLKTSNAEFRQNYLTITRKLFERLRINYDADITGRKKNSKFCKQKQYFQNMKQFLQELTKICFNQVYVEAIFQIVQPALQILNLISSYFSPLDIEIKKGQKFQKTDILKQTCFYQSANFENLLNCLQSSYESIRNSASILLNCYSSIKDQALLKKIWKQSLDHTNKLAIRKYEYACRIITFLAKQYYQILPLDNKKYQLKLLNVCDYLLSLLKDRFKVFQSEFEKQTSIYYSNLIHGILTCFSYLFDNISASLAMEKSSKVLAEIKQFMSDFMKQINRVLMFAVEISSTNISTVVLDTLIPQRNQTDVKTGLKVDCRGHFLNQSSSDKKLGKYLDSTALMSSMENEEQGIQNTMVVSFYLLTRQAGLVFQSIGNLVGNSNSLSYLSVDILIELINTYFYALINLKHMGSVDRISIGLSKMSKIIFKHQNQQLAKIPESLLKKLIGLLKDGHFTNILRRSAGVPYAFSCLLKSEAVKRKSLIQQVVMTLLNLAVDLKSVAQFRVHSLNILKKLFQDSDLKQDLDLYLSKAFITSIQGFSSEDWNIRNSSLMLFSTLANRTVGIKPTYNLLEFFQKCPQMLSFMEKQLSKKFDGVMYPSLYPMVLLLSRLLPFDLKQKARMTIKGESIKQLRKEQLLKLLPLVEKAGHNANYMGRAMTAKALLPFMEVNNIIPYCMSIMNQLKEYAKDLNKCHYNLLRIFHLLVSYFQIITNTPILSKQNNPYSNLVRDSLKTNYKYITAIECPTAQQVLIKIYDILLKNQLKQSQQEVQNQNSIVQNVAQQLRTLLKRYLYQSPRFIISKDMGASLMRKAAISLYLRITAQNIKNKSTNPHAQLVAFLQQQLKKDNNYLKKIDTEPVVQYLQIANQMILDIQNSNEIRQSLTKAYTEFVISLQSNQVPDTILTPLLQLCSNIKTQLTNSQQNLKILINKTRNSKLQIELFKYFITFNQSSDNKEIVQLLEVYSGPDELQQLRQACIQYLSNQKQLEDFHYITCIRLLQDQQPELRKAAGQQIARCLNIYQYNDSVLKNILIQKLREDDLRKLLRINSDYDTKRKNSIQQRIFSYDKPNKYRSDIETLFYCLTHNKQIPKQSIRVIFAQQYERSDESTKKSIDVIPQEYKQDVLGRNQFMFQNAIRFIILHPNSQKSRALSQIHPWALAVFSALKSQ